MRARASLSRFLKLTSVKLIERAHARALADKLTLAEMMRIWRCIGRVIGASLILGKGVNVDGLGVFCFDLDGVDPDAAAARGPPWIALFCKV